MKRQWTTFRGIVGLSGSRRVFLGFAAARTLHALSFPDVLDEETGRGYQRRPNPEHSLDFRRYIQRPGSATIPLTLNARLMRGGAAWRLIQSGRLARLEVRTDAGPVLAQVDCQHRLGHLNELNTSLPFMCFLGLTQREEMEVFNVINSKAKGLSASLLDFHAATLATDLASERPELLIALHLHNDEASPWFKQLDLGGHSTSGLRRRASLRTMQKAVKRFLSQTRLTQGVAPAVAARVVLAFWSAVKDVLPGEWAAPRKHLLNKGVGVYALMMLASDLVLEAQDHSKCDRRYFAAKLVDFLPNIDWTNTGPLKGLGGEAGVKEAIAALRSARSAKRLKVVRRG
jgi:DGQHR domain-containing protein